MSGAVLKITLATTAEQFNSLHQSCDVRADVNFVMVNKEALLNLIFDHCQVLGLCQEEFKQWCYFVDGDEGAVQEALDAFELYRKGQVVKKAEEESDEDGNTDEFGESSY